jgi:hypothetical protein
MMMKYTIAISVFVSAVFAQQSAFPSQCISSCSGVLSISEGCANSTGYTFDSDVVLAQEYLNCICASSNTGIMNQSDRPCNISANARCLQCAQQAGEGLGGIVNAQQACASGTANLNSFTSQYGQTFTGIASDFSGISAATVGSAGAGTTNMATTAAVQPNLGSASYLQESSPTPASTAASAKTTSAMPTQASSAADCTRVSVYNMVLLGFVMVLVGPHVV